MAEEEEVFEIDDFTAASDWERFIYDIEEIIGPHCWQLDNTQKSNKQEERSSVVVKQKNLQYVNHNFVLVYHKLSETEPKFTEGALTEGLAQAVVDSCDYNFDFPSRAHILSRCFGVKEFIILSPAKDEAAVEGETKINLLRSSVCIAISNLNCQLPVFVQVGAAWRLLFYGTCLGEGMRTSYETVHLKYTPHQCNHAAGLIDVFKEKLGGGSLESSVMMSIRFTYQIKDWPVDVWFQEAPDVSDEFEGEVGVSSLHRLPFGPVKDPTLFFMLATTWNGIDSNVVVDDENFSDLDPMQAPEWSLKVRFDEQCASLLFDHLMLLVQVCQQTTSSTQQIINALTTPDDTSSSSLGDVTSVLDRLAEPDTGALKLDLVGSAARQVMKTRYSHSPLTDELLNKALNFLFPDANLCEEEAWLLQGQLDDQQKKLECDANRAKDKYRSIKGAPVDSLTSAVANCITILNHGYGGIKAIAQLWHEFVLEMRFRYENNILIPRLAQTTPNLNYCLVHQKLQMLNYCIQRRQQRNEKAKSQPKKQPILATQSVSYKQFSKRDHSWNSLLSNLEDNSKDGVENSKNEETFTNQNDNNFKNKVNSENECEKNVANETRENFESFQTFSGDGWESDDEFFEACEEFSSSKEDVGSSKEDIDASEKLKNKKTSEENLQEDININISEQLNNETVGNLPDGVLQETEMLLLVTREKLCIPITQEPPPLTEDILTEQQTIMEGLGTSEEAARIRAQMQSMSLHADMEAFKAANPGCILEDFVRWYSPNDWLEGPQTEEEREELKKIAPEEGDKEDPEWACAGHMSLRMRVPGNTWQEVWKGARATPARRQKRLFDDTKEAEKVLHFLSNLTPSEIVLQLFPVVIQSSIIRIHQEEESSLFHGEIEKLLKEASYLQMLSLEKVHAMEGVARHIRFVEMGVAKVKSLQMKIQNEEDDEDEEELRLMVQRLLTQECRVEGGARSKIGKILTDLLHYQKEEDYAASMENPNQPPARASNLSSKHKDIPLPHGREYILRTVMKRPSVTSRATPQRLYAAVTPADFRLAGCFTQDGNFL